MPRVRGRQLHPLLVCVGEHDGIIEGLRAIIYGGAAPGAGRILYVVAAAALAVLLGRTLFLRMQGELAVVL